jgi:hypothetical protein
VTRAAAAASLTVTRESDRDSERDTGPGAGAAVSERRDYHGRPAGGTGAGDRSPGRHGGRSNHWHDPSPTAGHDPSPTRTQCSRCPSLVHLMINDDGNLNLEPGDILVTVLVT